MVLLKIGVYARVETRGGGGGGGGGGVGGGAVYCHKRGYTDIVFSFGNRIQSTPSKIETFGTDTKCPF